MIPGHLAPERPGEETRGRGVVKSRSIAHPRVPRSTAPTQSPGPSQSIQRGPNAPAVTLRTEAVF